MVTSAEKIMTLINSQVVDPPAPITSETVTFENPIADENSEWNTLLTVKAVPEGGYKGEAIVKYKRIDLSELGNPVEIYLSGEVTLENVCIYLNSYLDAEITPDDIIGFISPGEDGGDVPVSALAESLGWRGNTVLRISKVPALRSLFVGDELGIF